LDYINKSLAGYDPERFRARGFPLGNDPGVVGLSVSALLMWMQGFPDLALQRANDAIVLATRLNYPYSKAYALFHITLLYLWRREVKPAQERAQAVLEIAEEHEFQVWRAVATCLHGAALAGMGQPEEGLAQVQQGIHQYQVLNTPPVFWPQLLYVQAEVYGQEGKPEEGLATLDKAFEIIGLESEDIASAEFYRLKGDLLLTLSPDHAPEAESWFHRALKVAQMLQLPMLELRAALSLGRLWLQNTHLENQDKAEQASRLLSDAYEKFSEGFTTADLVDARDLLSRPSDSN
jgi:adenylate cyclase